jgi:asparagine synthetase B (glutamine-hydrolysing)
MLMKLRGMFAFAIYNKDTKALFMARDFFGIKPLHYTMIGDDFCYASEIKSILEHPKFEKRFNRKALDAYLSFQYSQVVPSSHTRPSLNSGELLHLHTQLANWPLPLPLLILPTKPFLWGRRCIQEPQV